MRNKYYYLVTALPYLRLEEKPAVSGESFLSECAKWLSPSDFALLESAGTADPPAPSNGNRILKEWRSLDASFRRDLSAARRIRQQASGERLPVSVASVFSKATPLLMEKEIAAKRWAILDGLEYGRYFDIDFLIIYFLKLRILERLISFNRDEGIKVFDDACEVQYA